MSEHTVIESKVYYFYYCPACMTEWYSLKYEPKKRCKWCDAEGVVVRLK